MRKSFLHSALFRLLVPVFYGVLIYTLILLIGNNIDQLFTTFIGEEMYVCIAISYCLSEGLRLLSLALDRFLRTEKYRAVIQVTLGITVACILTSLIIKAYFDYIVLFSITENQLILFNIIFGVSSVFYNLLYFSNLYLYRENEVQLEIQRQKTELLDAELSQFKNEVNPALLYDSLETLITLGHKNAEEAEEYIDHLSLVYRHILSHRKTEFATLEKELASTENLVHLLNYNFSNLIKFTSNIDEKLMELNLVPGTLASIVESVVRSSIINIHSPMHVSLEVDHAEGYFILEHVLNEKLVNYYPVDNSFESIQHSYSFYSEKPVVRIKAHDVGYVKFPILEMANSEVLI